MELDLQLGIFLAWKYDILRISMQAFLKSRYSNKSYGQQ